MLPLLKKQRHRKTPMYMEAQREAWSNPAKIKESNVCGCYHCLKTFTHWDITKWIDDLYYGPVPLCPYCQQDSVIGDAHGYPITEELLKEIRNYCYDKDEWWGE